MSFDFVGNFLRKVNMITYKMCRLNLHKDHSVSGGFSSKFVAVDIVRLFFNCIICKVYLTAPTNNELILLMVRTHA